jgi:anthranilate synthase/aminodeoxychorismate synthase-like glutamine amidotransferase
MIVIIDNYDSFSYNLYQMIGAIDNDVRVVRNDVVTPEEVLAMKPMAIVLSPGPGRPCDAGICEDMIRVAKGKVPILGVCLGHQAICEVFGAIVTYASHLMHGKWMAFAECFIDGLSCKRTAEKIHVTPRTAWFMRVRTLEALQKNLPSFEVKADSGAEIDEIFFPESFKGISFKNLGRIPREPRREGRGTRTRGISNEQICVVTGINDNGDMFYDVACRGRRTDPRQ